MKIIALLVGGLLLSSTGIAGIIQTDYQESLDLPGFSISLGPCVEQLLAVSLPAPSPQLTAADIIANPSAWSNSLDVSFDPATSILSLTGDGNNDYQIITVTLSNLLFSVPGEVVTGITPISTGHAVQPDGGDADPTLTTTPFFTADSFGVTYTSADYLASTNDFYITGQTDTFQIALSDPAVPEPGTLGLIGAPLIALFFGFRRKL